MLAGIIASASLLIVGCFGMGAIIFIVWAIHEHHVANKYRQLIALHEAQGAITKSDKWIITYKDGRNIKTVSSPKATESEALAEFIRSRVQHSSIISVTEVT